MKRIFAFGISILLLAGCTADVQNSSADSQSVSSSANSMPAVFEPEITVTATEVPLPQGESIKWREATICGDEIALTGQVSDVDSEGLYGAAAQYCLYRYSSADNTSSLLTFDTPIANGWTDGESDYWMAVNDWSVWCQPYGGEKEKIAEGIKRGMGAPYLTLSEGVLLWEEYEATQTQPPYLELYSLVNSSRKTIEMPGRIASVNVSNGVATAVCEADGKILLSAYDLTSGEKIGGMETSLAPKASKSMESSALLLNGNALVKQQNGSLMLQKASGETIEICKSDVKSFAFWENAVLYTTKNALMLYDPESAQTAELHVLEDSERFFSGLIQNNGKSGVFLERDTADETNIIWMELK